MSFDYAGALRHYATAINDLARRVTELEREVGELKSLVLVRDAANRKDAPDE